MKSYCDLINQTFDFPQKEFSVNQNKLCFNGVSLMDIIEQYGTPLKLTYLPRIGENIRYVQALFDKAIKRFQYQARHTYCYCTKSSYFPFIMEEVLKNHVHIETSSGFDIPIIKSLYRRGMIKKDMSILCNGFKIPNYADQIASLINEDFNCVPILDTINEITVYEQKINKPFNVGIRVASDEEPKFEFYTSRLGIRYDDVIPLYLEKIKNSKNASLKMLHFFISTGIKDSAYYWSELSRFIFKYCALKKVCPSLESINIGGGLPFKQSLTFNYDYEYMIGQVVENIKWICDKNNVPVPYIFTEFGSYTVSESGAILYSIIDQKLQNDKELWYMINGSFITQMPDTWGLNQKYILLPINKWDNPYHKVNMGGLTCDSMDYYNSEAHTGEVFLPIIQDDKPLHIGFFHTGAYQDSLGGYGGIQHCLVPAPKHVLIHRNKNNKISTSLFADEQTSQSMMRALRY